MVPRLVRFCRPASIMAAVVLSISTLSLVLGTGVAHAATTKSVVLIPDPQAYCIENPPDQLNVQEAGWTVIFNKLVGTPRKNNWQCRYHIYPTIPLANLEGDDGALPGIPYYANFPINWNLMCRQQFPGSKAQYVSGPVGVVRYGPYGAPWVCVGPAKYVGEAEDE